MTAQTLIDTARALVAGDKGLLAMDESNATCNKRFAVQGVPQTEAARRDWRELIVTAPGLADSISGAILFDETIRQKTNAGAPFAKALAGVGIIPGIKVDTGAKPLAGHPGETVTEGLDGLRERLAEYAGMGARFAKWRGVIAIDKGLPTRACRRRHDHRADRRRRAACPAARAVRAAPRFKDIKVAQILAMRKYGYFEQECRPHVRHAALFFGGASRAGGQGGWCDFIPNYFSEIPALIERGLMPADVVFAMASPMSASGTSPSAWAPTTRWRRSPRRARWCSR
jgi:hypothetical protein